MCARGTSGKTDDRGKSRKLVCGNVLEEIYRDGDRMECTEIVEQQEWNREDEQREGERAGAREQLGGQLGEMEAVF